MSDKLEAATHGPEPERVPMWVGEKGPEVFYPRLPDPSRPPESAPLWQMLVLFGVVLLVSFVGILSAR